MDPVPDPLLLRKSGSAGNRTRDLCICSQTLWPLDHRDGPVGLISLSYLMTSAWHTFASIMHMCGYPVRCWSWTCCIYAWFHDTTYAVCTSTSWWWIFRSVTPFTCKVKSHCALKHFMMFPVGLPSVNSVYGDTTCLWCGIVAADNLCVPTAQWSMQSDDAI